MKGLLAGVLIAFALACTRGPDALRPARVAKLAPLSRNELTQLALSHCASCHQSSLSRAKPEALRAFDLDHADWSDGLSAAQRGFFYERMSGLLAPETRARLLAFVRPETSAANPR